MRLISVPHKNGKDVWAVIHQGDEEDGVFEFFAAFMNGVQMEETVKVEGVQEQQEGSKKKKIKFDKKQMKEDFDNHPGDDVGGSRAVDPPKEIKEGPPGQVMRLIRNKKWCLPLRGPGGVIIYTCDGVGPYSCG